MRHVNGLYTQYFNRSEGKDGALFGGRYKAFLVDAEEGEKGSNLVIYS